MGENLRKMRVECAKKAVFRYFNVEGSSGVVSVCLADSNVLLISDSSERSNRYYYGVAFCSPKDQFVKREGRYKSLERMLYNFKGKDA